MKQPNIVFVFCDQWRFDCISGFGHPDVQTPHLDALFADGVGFDNVVTPCPLCVPARMSLFSGRYVHQHGGYNNSQGLWPDSPNMVRCIRDQGYDTVQRGKLHLFWRHDNELTMSDPLLDAFGFTDAVETTGKCSAGRLRGSAYTEFLRSRGKLMPFWKDLADRSWNRKGTPAWGKSILNEDEHIDTWIMNRGVDCLKAYQASKKPYLLWVGPPGPHDPFDPAGRWATMYNPDTLDVGLRRDSQDPCTLEFVHKEHGDRYRQAPDHVIRQMRSQYYGNISAIDDGIGKMVSELKSQNRYDQTWFVFAADHGEMLGDFHCTGKTIFHRASDQIPLIIKPPAHYTQCPRGTLSHALVELIDIGSTLNDIAGGQLQDDMGRSLLPLLTGRKNVHHFREVCFSQFKANAMFRTPTRKLIYTFDQMFAVDQKPTLNTLYHLDIDPDETTNQLQDHMDEAMALYEKYAQPFYMKTSPEKLPDLWEDQEPWSKWGCYPHVDSMYKD